VVTTSDLSQVKIAILQQLDKTLRQNYHQTLVEVLNELRMRDIVSQPDLSPDNVFSIILETHVLSYKPCPSVENLRDALERLTQGKYGWCVVCGREIGVETLLADPTISRCKRCQSRANS
jgi:RNA polymerase-binding transcription factor DksA